MIGVVIPAHNEAAVIGSCLATVKAAAASPLLWSAARVFIGAGVDSSTEQHNAVNRASGTATGQSE